MRNISADLTHRLSIEYPVIQAPMFGVSTPEMTATASNTGALGSLALADLTYNQCAELIRKTRQLTSRPFAANIFLHTLPAITAELKDRYQRTKAFLEQLAKENGINVSLPEFDTIQLTDYKDQLDAIVEYGVKILSFTFGNLDPESIRFLKSKQVVLIGTCTSVTEALQLEASGIDIICVQGIEAGGHRGSFTERNIPEIGGLSLLATVRDAVKTPLIYAGGLYNGATMHAAKALGAAGFQLGSIFLCAQESALEEFEKQRLLKATENEIMLISSYTGRYARGIANHYVQLAENSGMTLPYPYQNKLTRALRDVAKQQKNAEFINLWAGQSLHTYSRDSTASIIGSLISQLPH
ncbi:NAD(P)H-dependent flavin oxidoreductase [Sediminibacterium ginsengisoli]|uniref:Propionate 3-nitronate monooxygenase n=1 Tax=Sediminibacterium ginsengisoli TaxID=413434 RepID=A0A1T4LAW6_9BACT|nr:nitronate monooxygenase [Sediminibacterium ginsengisoli]SJZ51704.1 nitronate monooxygenase [Sediminibacterium ginsengisoli]